MTIVMRCLQFDNCFFTVKCGCVSVVQIYDLSQVPSWSELTSTSTLFIGAGAGPSHITGNLTEVSIFLLLLFTAVIGQIIAVLSCCYIYCCKVATHNAT